MVSVLASRAVDRGFETRSVQTKDYEMDICCFSAKHAVLRRKTGWVAIGIMCPSGATCISAYCCLSKQALYKSNEACWSSTKRTSSSSHRKLTCPRHNVAEIFAELSLSNTHKLTNS